MSVASALANSTAVNAPHKDNLISRFKHLDKKEKRTRILNLVAMIMISGFQCAASCLTFSPNATVSKVFLFLNLFISLVGFFYKRTYFLSTQAFTLTNGIFLMAGCSLILDYQWKTWIIYVFAPICSVLLMIGFLFTPRNTSLLQIIASMNTFHQIGKYSDQWKWYVTASLLAAYLLVIVPLLLKNRNAAIYTSRTINLFQLTSLTLDSALRIFELPVEHNRSILMANILFGITIVCVSLLQVPKIKKNVNEKKEMEGSELEYPEAKFSSELPPMPNNEAEQTGTFVGGNAFSVAEPVVSSIKGWDETQQEQVIDDTPFVAKTEEDEEFYGALHEKMVHQ